MKNLLTRYAVEKGSIPACIHIPLNTSKNTPTTWQDAIDNLQD